ncbi:hypothetical protein Tco_0507718 [Tanacetum coccineum]
MFADISLHVSLDEIKVDKTLRFVEEPIENSDREVKCLKCSRMVVVKVHLGLKRAKQSYVYWIVGTFRPVVLRYDMFGIVDPNMQNEVNMDDPNITIEEYIRLEKGIARRSGQLYTTSETATYDKDNDDDDKVDIEHSFGDLSVKPLPGVINTDNLVKEILTDIGGEIYKSGNLEVLES